MSSDSGNFSFEENARTAFSSPAGLTGQADPRPGPQHLGSDTAEAAKRPQGRHLYGAADRGKENRAEVAPARLLVSFPPIGTMESPSWKLAGRSIANGTTSGFRVSASLALK